MQSRRLLYPDFSESTSTWEKTPVRSVMRLETQLVGDGWSDSQLLSLTKQGVISRDIESGVGKYPASFEGYQYLETDDLVFCLFDVEETPRTIGRSTQSGMITAAYTRYRVDRKRAEPKFLEWYFLALDDQKRYRPFYSGLRNTIPKSVLSGTRISLPPIPVQKAIVEFLDRETAQIDNLIAKQEQLIVTLRERRASVIHNAVSKGLSPETEMISVNTPWLSYMPVQWNLVTLKRNAYIKARVGWKGMTSDEFEAESFAYLVTGRDFLSRTIDLRECYQVSQERFVDDPFIQLRKGDLLVTKDGSIGKTALVGELDKPACLNSGVFLVRANKNCQNSFLYWVLNSNVFNEFIALQASGSTIQHLYQNVFETFKFGLPSLEEQEQIVGYLEDETARIDELISKAKELNVLLKTRRQALISAAVTGKISVGA